MPAGLEYKDVPKLLKYYSVPGSVILFPLVHVLQPRGRTAVHSGGMRRQAGQGKMQFLLKLTGPEALLSTFCKMNLVTCAFVSFPPGTERKMHLHLGGRGESLLPSLLLLLPAQGHPEDGCDEHLMQNLPAMARAL